VRSEVRRTGSNSKVGDVSRRLLLRLGVSAGFVCGCGEAPLTCPSILQPGISVVVKDSLTDGFVGSGATVVARAADHSDSVSFPAGHAELDASAFDVAWGQGLYSVTVTKPGYAEWQRTNVSVVAHGCEIQRVVLTARLKLP
jgi:hypothetical protein